MTSDAKIGLLLGLVFIFVIAFIINGLPTFGSRAQNAEAAPPMTSQDDNLGLADRAQNAQERLDWTTLLERDGTGRALASEDLPASTPEPVTPQPQPTVARDSGEVRSVYALDSLVNGVSRTLEDVVKGLSEASEAVMMQKQTNEPVPTLDIPSAPAVEASRRVSPANAAARRPVVRTYYEVQNGDVLATVAKKVYGSVEGNRLVNIRRIYQANATVLNSPDEIFVGQKLVIPPLPEVKEGADKPNPTLSEGTFERVEAVGRRNLADIKEAKPEGRWYVVQDGDNLWKIASSQLGSGARCDEIAKLNTDTLKNKDVLDIGMRLRLPSK